MKKRSIYQLFSHDYPKLTILLIFAITAYLIFRNPSVQSFAENMGSLSYFGIFIAGMLFTFGFTTPFSVGFFIISTPENIFLAALIGGTGALIGDLVIFKFIRLNFIDEFKRIEKTEAMRKLTWLLKKEFSHKIRVYLLYLFAGIIIASPMPDEAGIIMLAGLSQIKTKILAIISLVFNTLGILVVLFI